MKILLLNANRAGIGTYHRALYFGRELARRGHVVTLMTVSNRKRFRPEVHVDSTRMTIVEGPNLLDEWLPWHASGPLDIATRILEIWRGNYDVVYAFEYQPNISIPVFAMRGLRRFTLISDWCDWHAGASYHFGGYRIAHRIDQFFEELIRYYASHVTTINKTLYDRAQSIGIDRERISIVGEGVDPSYITPIDLLVARKHLGIDPNSRIVGTIRDADRSAQILCGAIAMSRFPDVALLYIGNQPEAVRRHAANLGVSDRLITPGRVSVKELPLWIAASDLLALPLEDNLVNRGRWPHKIGDMLAARRPVVLGRAGEFADLIAQKSCALFADYEEASFARAIDSILDAPSEFEAMATRGRQLIEEQLNWDVIGVHLEAALQKAVASERHVA